MKFRFHNSLHLGSDMPGVGEEASKTILHSDTIFSSICNVWAQIDRYLQKQNCISFQEMLQLFVNGVPPFKFSSGFPFFNNDYYLPKPMRDPSMLYDDYITKSIYGKKVKRLQFLKAQYFREWMTENKQESGMAHDLSDENKNRPSFGIELLLPKTPVNRLNNESNIYHTSQFYFYDYCGLYVIVELNENIISKSQFCTLLDHLGKYGFGGNRSTGQGSIQGDIIFEKAPKEITQLFTMKSEMGYCLLSLYYPFNNSIVRNATEYSLTLRKGWIGSYSANKSLKKKTAYMFSEGSLFSDIDKGRLVDTKPDKFTEHDIWQYGYAMTMPSKKEIEIV